MNDDLARSMDPFKQRAKELENEIKRISTEIQASHDRKQLRLLADELRKALWRMDDLERELKVHYVHSPFAASSALDRIYQHLANCQIVKGELR